MTPEKENTIVQDGDVVMGVDLESQDTPNVNPEPEAPATTETPKEPSYELGVVVDCMKLNVRKHPSVNAPVVCTIPKGTKVAAFEEDSDEFYRIETVAGVEGYCMKKYIDVNQ